jgi:uncharacterized protein (DUF2384 family)
MRLVPIELEAENPAGGRITDDEAAALARAVVALFRRWALTDSQACALLGGVSTATYSRWKRGAVGRIGVDLATRLATLIGIHKSLRILFTDTSRVYEWVRRPNQVFGGQSALDVMLRGRLTDLLRVRAYLDAERG